MRKLPQYFTDLQVYFIDTNRICGWSSGWVLEDFLLERLVAPPPTLSSLIVSIYFCTEHKL